MKRLGLYHGYGTTQKVDNQNGYVIVSVLIITLIAGILLSGSMRTTHNTEQLAGHAIQYSRAMEAAEGGAIVAQNDLMDLQGVRRFADAFATDGVFSLDAVDEKWWDNPTFSGNHDVGAGMLMGVAETPTYVYEQVGEYAADGGTGIVNMDIGGASYGKTSAGAREYVLYTVQAQGVGSKTDVERAVETTVIVTR